MSLVLLQSGCCKPPTSCAYNIVGTMVVFDEDCYRLHLIPVKSLQFFNFFPFILNSWPKTSAIEKLKYCRWSNDSGLLCYQCNSCKAGALEQVRRDWHNISVLNIVVVVFLMAVYAIGCCAFRNVRRAESEYPHSTHATMSKIHPRWDYHWFVLSHLLSCYCFWLYFTIYLFSLRY